MAKEKLEFDKYSVSLDPEFLRFEDATLSKYIQTEGGYYDNFGHYLSLAERNLQNKESACEKLFCERFIEAKEAGSSDKLAEAKAKADVDVVFIKNEIIQAKYVVNRLKIHLKAWDKNHDNAQSLGHMLRKQMDKLNTDVIYSTGYGSNYYNSNIDEEIKSTVTSFEDFKKQENDFDTNLNIEGLI
jgi:hypothetical protein